MGQYNPLFEIKAKYEKQLLKLANVVSVGIGYKEREGVKTSQLAVCVNVSQKLPIELLAKADLVPKTLDGVITDVQEIGIIKALPDSITAEVEEDRTKRVRPARGGFSIGNVRITAGTLGCLVYRDKQPYILSNAHVLTPDPTAFPPASAEIIVQPGIYDGGNALLDQVALLTEYKVIRPFLDLSTCQISTGVGKGLSRTAKLFKRQSRFYVFAETQAVNQIDAALALPTETISPVVEGIGIPNGVYTQPSPLGLPVIKSGRTSGITTGTITQMEVTANVQYSQFQWVQFQRQLMIESIEAFSQPGDSGSIIFVDDSLEDVIGLLFAGNEKGTATFANPIELVLQELNVSLIPGY